MKKTYEPIIQRERVAAWAYSSRLPVSLRLLLLFTFLLNLLFRLLSLLLLSLTFFVNSFIAPSSIQFAPSSNQNRTNMYMEMFVFVHLILYEHGYLIQYIYCVCVIVFVYLKKRNMFVFVCLNSKPTYMNKQTYINKCK